MIKGRVYRAHRLAWLHFYGEWPSGLIDHINGDKVDNRIINLRIANKTINGQNYQSPNRNNKTGFLGVHLEKNTGRYRAQIKVGQTRMKLGSFPTPEEAHYAYLDAKRHLHAGCTI